MLNKKEIEDINYFKDIIAIEQINAYHQLQENKKYMKRMIFNKENFLEKVIYEKK